MSIELLSDTGEYPRPRFFGYLACCTDFVVGRLYRIEKMIPPGYHIPPGALIISNHLRDSDVPILTVALCHRRGLHFHETLPFFAAREDLFQRDGLARLCWPSLQGRLPAMIPLAWFLRRLRVRPLRRLREFTLADTISELIVAGQGGMRPADLFNARGQRELTAQLGQLPPRVAAIESRQLGRLRCAIWGLRRLRLATLRRLDGGFRAHFMHQLADFATQLDEGGAVYIAPEGVISCTGRFGAVRAGPLQICRRARVPVAILPNALSYDPLRSGRLRVLVRAGEPIRGLDRTDPCHFANSLRLAILRLRVVTTSHLIAWFLCVTRGQFTTRQFIAGLQRGVDIAVATGTAIDPLLERGPLDALAAQRLRWLQRRRLVRRDGGRWENTLPAHAQPGWGDPAAIVMFLANSLADLGPAWRAGTTA